MPKNKVIEKLADFIESNPDCSFEIDNDCWYINDKNGNQIACDGDFVTNTDWYSSGNLYGASLSEAMVVLLNRKGFDIKASAV